MGIIRVPVGESREKAAGMQSFRGHSAANTDSFGGNIGDPRGKSGGALAADSPGRQASGGANEAKKCGIDRGFLSG